MRSEKIQLTEILKYGGLSSGYSFRGKISHNPNGTVKVIQLKNFTNNYTAIIDNCDLIDGDKIKDKYFLEENDILFIAKGSNNFALTFKKIGTIPTIASSALFVIKVDTQFVDPEYVAWYINQTPVQNYLKNNESGTYTTSIGKQTLEQTPIVLPSLTKQKRIAQIATLQNREQTLFELIKTLRKKVTQYQLLNSI